MLITLHSIFNHLLSLIFPTDPKISLEESDYFVSEEDGMLRVCAVVSEGTLSSSVVVTITTLPSTATCEIPTVYGGPVVEFAISCILNYCSFVLYDVNQLQYWNGYLKIVIL